MIVARRDVAARIDARRRDLVPRIVEAHFAQDPGLRLRYGTQGWHRCVEDAEYHLNYLGEAVAAGSSALFVDYVTWARELLESRRVPAADLDANLAVTSQAVRELLGDGDADVADLYLAAGRSVLASAAAPAKPAQAELSELARDYMLALLEGNRLAAEGLVVQALGRGGDIRAIYLDVFEAVQREIGRRWQRNQLTVAQEHLCTAATERIMARLFARHVIATPAQRSIVIASVASELHAMGPRILADFFEMDGWDVHYLGANAPAVSVVEIVRDRQASALAISATMTYHIAHVRDLIIRVRARRDLPDVKVLAGGHPFNVEPGLWLAVGADGTARDAPSAVAEARRLTGLS